MHGSSGKYFKRAPAVDVDGDGLADPKIRDADGQQLAQSTAAGLRAAAAWDEFRFESGGAGLDLQSTEHRRAIRARTLRKR